MRRAEPESVSANTSLQMRPGPAGMNMLRDSDTPQSVLHNTRGLLHTTRLRLHQGVV